MILVFKGGLARCEMPVVTLLIFGVAVCRLHRVPSQIQRCKQLTRLELSFNPMGLDYHDSALFTGQHQLRILGLRLLDEEDWIASDVQAVADIQRNCTRNNGSTPEIVCWLELMEQHDELDSETGVLEED